MKIKKLFYFIIKIIFIYLFFSSILFAQSNDYPNLIPGSAPLRDDQIKSDIMLSQIKEMHDSILNMTNAGTDRIKAILLGRATNLDSYSRYIQARGAYENLISQARLIRAQTIIALIQAKILNANLELWQEEVDFFQREINLYKKESRTLAADVNRFKHAVKIASRLKIGDSSSKSIQAFLDIIAVIDIGSVGEDMAEDIGPLGAENFSLPHDSDLVIIPSFKSGNVWELLEFLQVNGLKLRLGKTAHLKILKLFSSIESAIDQEMMSLKSEILDLRDTTLDIVRRLVPADTGKYNPFINFGYNSVTRY